MAAKPWIIQPLTLPVGDRIYEVWPSEYSVGLSLVAVQRGTSTEINDDTEDAVLFALVMGATWQAMLDDKQPFPVMFRAGLAALQYQTAMIAGLENGAAVEIGERVWETGQLPEAVAAQVAAAQQAVISPTSTSTGSARKTPQRASLKTTKSRTATPRPRKSTTTAPRKSLGTTSPNASP